MSVGTGKAYRVIYNGNIDGAQPFIDRSWTLRGVFGEAAGFELVQTAWDDGQSTVTPSLVISLSERAYVGVFYGHTTTTTQTPAWWVSDYVHQGRGQYLEPAIGTTSERGQVFGPGTVEFPAWNDGTPNVGGMYYVAVAPCSRINDCAGLP